MWEESLGSDERFYHENLKKIIPHLNSLSNKKYSRQVKILCKGIGVEPETDSDIEAIFNDLVRRVGGEEFKIAKHDYNECSSELTSWGLLKRETNYQYLQLSKAGFIRYGRERNKEQSLLMLISWLACKKEYVDIAPILENHLCFEEKEKRGVALERYIRKNIKRSGLRAPPSIFDKHAAIVFDDEKWERSFRDDLLQVIKEDAEQTIQAVKMIGMWLKQMTPHTKTSEEMRQSVMEDGKPLIESYLPTLYAIFNLPDNKTSRWVIINRIRLGAMVYEERFKTQPPDYPMSNPEKPIANNWFTLLSKIRAIRYMEKIAREEFLKSDPELRKIWNVPKETWRRKIAFFR